MPKTKRVDSLPKKKRLFMEARGPVIISKTLTLACAMGMDAFIGFLPQSNENEAFKFTYCTIPFHEFEEKYRTSPLKEYVLIGNRKLRDQMKKSNPKRMVIPFNQSHKLPSSINVYGCKEEPLVGDIERADFNPNSKDDE